MIRREEMQPIDEAQAVKWSDDALDAMKRWEQRSDAEKARDLAELRDFGERSQRLEAMRPELTEKYPDRWVALTESYQQVVADTITELVAKIQDLGERPEFSAAKCMHTRRRRTIPG